MLVWINCLTWQNYIGTSQEKGEILESGRLKKKTNK